MPRAGRSGDEFRHGADLGRSQPGHDLVEQHQFWPQRQCAGDLQPFEQTDGERGDRRPGIVGEADVRERRFRERASARDRPFMLECGQHDVFDRGKLPVRLGYLEGAGDAKPCDPVRWPFGDRLPGKHDLASGRLERAGDQIVERALAGAVRPDQAEKLALGDIEADVIDGP